MKENTSQTLDLVRREDGNWTFTMPEVADMEKAGMLDSVESNKVLGIPLGDAVVGGGLALILSDLVTAVLNPTSLGVPAGATQLVLAWLVANYGKKWLGQSTANLSAAFLAFEGIRDIIPIDTWLTKALSRIKGFIPSANTSQDHPPAPQQHDDSPSATSAEITAWLNAK